MIDGIHGRRPAKFFRSGANRPTNPSIVVGDHSRDQAQPPAPATAQPAPKIDQPNPVFAAPGNTPPKKRRSLKEWLKARTKKQWIIFAAIAVFVIGGGVAAFMAFSGDPKPVVKKVQTKTQAPPKPTTEASKLTGLQVDPAVNKRAVTAVMIENSPDARPQSGIEQAGVVFEAIAEGGITRFLTLFQDDTPAYVGPIRSVRPYYLDWLLGFDAPVAHVGGSAQALQLIKQLGVKDLDYGANPNYYHRIASRYAPHNVYTSMAELHQLEAKKGFGTSEYTSLARKVKETPAVSPPTARVINFNISGQAYNPRFEFDAATNKYKRFQAGAPHMMVDQTGGQVQLEPKVVIGLVMAQGSAGIYTTYGTLGTGKAYIFQNGTVTEGTWNKNSQKENYKFTDAAGKPILLNHGQTWFSAVGSADRVSFTP